MNETPLQKLLRLRKEKEQANVNPSPTSNSETQLESSTLEAVSGQSGSSSMSTGTEGSGTNPSEGAVELLEERVPEVQAKPMSAMERLRALKSGGSNFNEAGKGVVESTIAKQEETGPKEVTPPKPRKTHPIAMEMAELEAALDAHVPGFVSILSTIHKKLKADPDVVTLLEDDEIAVIVAGLEKHTNVTIVAPSAVKAAKSKAKKEPVSAMDL